MCSAAGPKTRGSDMRHMTPARLETIEPLLEQIRAIDGLVERASGRFYRRSKPVLHIHPNGTNEGYADVKLNGVFFERMRATTKAEQKKLVAAIRRTLA